MTNLERAADLLSRGRYQEAFELFEREHFVNPRDPVPLRGAGAALKQLGRYAEAIDRLMRSTWLIARHAETWGMLGGCAYALRKYEDAVRYWREAVTTNPRYFMSRAEEERCWREARSHHSEYEAPLRRILRRNRLAEVPAFFENVRAVDDVVEAVAVGREMSQEQPGNRLLPLVIGLLQLRKGESSNLTVTALRDARSLATNQDEWLGFGEQLLNAIKGTASECLGPISLLFLHEADSDMARLVYRYAPEYSPAHVASLCHVGTDLLRYLRERATA